MKNPPKTPTSTTSSKKSPQSRSMTRPRTNERTKKRRNARDSRSNKRTSRTMRSTATIFFVFERRTEPSVFERGRRRASRLPRTPHHSARTNERMYSFTSCISRTHAASTSRLIAVPSDECVIHHSRHPGASHARARPDRDSRSTRWFIEDHSRVSPVSSRVSSRRHPSSRAPAPRISTRFSASIEAPTRARSRRITASRL